MAEYLLGTDPKTPLTLLRQKVDVSASGALIAAAAGKKIRVLALSLAATTSGTVKFQSASNDLTGDMNILGGTPLVMPYNPAVWFETNAGEAFNVTLATVTNLSGTITYILDS
jgi:hypothetical protein